MRTHSKILTQAKVDSQQRFPRALVPAAVLDNVDDGYLTSSEPRAGIY